MTCAPSLCSGCPSPDMCDLFHECRRSGCVPDEPVAPGLGAVAGGCCGMRIDGDLHVPILTRHEAEIMRQGAADFRAAAEGKAP